MTAYNTHNLAVHTIHQGLGKFLQLHLLHSLNQEKQ